MISFAIDTIGAADDACVGGGLVGEDGTAMRPRSALTKRGIETKCDRHAPNNRFGNTRRWWQLAWAVAAAEAGEPVTFLSVRPTAAAHRAPCYRSNHLRRLGRRAQ